MKQIIVTLQVDEDTVMNESGQNNLDDAISQELGWLHDSGMFVESWSFLEPEKSREEPHTCIAENAKHLPIENRIESASGRKQEPLSADKPTVLAEKDPHINI